MTITVKTPARLHLGLLDMNGGLGRLYGSIGLAIERPNVELEAEASDRLDISGTDTERAANFARRFLDHYSFSGGARLNLKSSIPAHIGLGSGTQLALAIGAALAGLGGLKLNIREIAGAMDRGIHSGIGIAIFEHGGFILDGGHSISGSRRRIPPLLFQASFPQDWYFIVAVPEGESGLSDERETQAFQNFPPAPQALVEKICRLLVMKMLPGLVEKDITGFGQALTEIQRLVGECFAAVQGGPFAHALSAQLIARMLEKGASGAGQTSWGPAVYALVEGKEKSLAMEKEVKSFLDNNDGGQVFIAGADNRGARITSTSHST